MKFLSKILLALYLLILLWLVLFKFTLDLTSISNYQTGLNLVPFADISKDSLGEMISNFMVFIPLGLLLSIGFGQASFRRKLGFILVFSVAAEIIQLVFAIGTTDITDVIMNTSGGLVGLVVYYLSKKYIDNKKLDRSIALAGTILIVLIFGILFSGKVRFQSAPTPETTLQAILSNNARFNWPRVGQAAVGSVEDGLIARSSKNEKPRPTASMAKIITALAIMEKQPLKPGQTGPSYTLTSEDIANYHAHAAKGGSVVPVYEGMVLTQYQAMQMMLIASDNNMADMLAKKVFGGTEAYISYAQDMLQRMELSRTVVADASGFSPATVSTPSELVTIGITALKNPVIAEIVAQQQAWIPNVGTIKNTNELLGVDGVVGIKTGTTNEAGSCLLFAASHTGPDGRRVTIVGVIMGNTNATSLFSDSRKLLASAKQEFDLVEVQSADSLTAPPSTRREQAPIQ